MQEKTWTLRTVDGQAYEGLSKQDATLMLARMIYGVEPAREAQVSRMPVVQELAAPIAA